MIDDDFDSWGDYIPVSDKKIEVVTNPNLIKILIDDDYQVFGWSSVEEFKDDFDNFSEIDYDNNEFIRFIKEDDKNGIKIFSCPKHEELFLVVNGDHKFIVYSYQNSGYYFDDNKLTFTGWDNNIIIDIVKMTSKTFNVR